MLVTTKVRTISGVAGPAKAIDACLFGISLNSRDVDVERTLAGWSWTRAKFPDSAMLIGDSLHRLTVRLWSGFAAREAHELAVERSVRLQRDLLDATCDCVLITTSGVARRTDWPARLARFEAAYRHDARFRTFVRSDALRFCERQRRSGRLGVTFERASDIAVTYVLEEIAVYDELAADGWRVETYEGGELLTLAAFMRGALPGLAPALERRVHISLKTKRR